MENPDMPTSGIALSPGRAMMKVNKRGSQDHNPRWDDPGRGDGRRPGGGAVGSGPLPPVAFAVGMWTLGPLSCVFAAWSVALLVLGLRGPRPRLVRLARQPGFVACLVTVVAMIIGGAWALLKLRSLDVGWMPFHLYWTDAVYWVPQAVAGAWLHDHGPALAPQAGLDRPLRSARRGLLGRPAWCLDFSPGLGQRTDDGKRYPVGRPPTRRLTGLDAAILVGFAGLAAASAFRIDREWAGGGEPAFARYDPGEGDTSMVPGPVTSFMRVHFDFVSAPGVMTLGVAIVAFRYPVDRRRGRLGPGRVAVAVAALFEVALLAKEVARMWPALGWPPSFSAVDWSKWLWVNMAPTVSGAPAPGRPWLCRPMASITRLARSPRAGRRLVLDR